MTQNNFDILEAVKELDHKVKPFISEVRCYLNDRNMFTISLNVYIKNKLLKRSFMIGIDDNKRVNIDLFNREWHLAVEHILKGITTEIEFNPEKDSTFARPEEGDERTIGEHLEDASPGITERITSFKKPILMVINVPTPYDGMICAECGRPRIKDKYSTIRHGDDAKKILFCSSECANSYHDSHKKYFYVKEDEIIPESFKLFNELTSALAIRGTVRTFIIEYHGNHVYYYINGGGHYTVGCKDKIQEHFYGKGKENE